MSSTSCWCKCQHETRDKMSLLHAHLAYDPCKRLKMIEWVEIVVDDILVWETNESLDWLNSLTELTYETWNWKNKFKK